MEELLERADPVMAWLGVLFALLVLFDLAVALDDSVSGALDIAGWVIWLMFVAEFALHLWVAERPGLFVKRHWLQVVALLVPTLRVLRLAGLIVAGRAFPAARALSSSYRAAGSSRALLRSRLGYLSGVSVVVIIVVAELAFIAERISPDSIFDSFVDALLWSAAVVLALQGDPTPSDPWARVVMLAGFAWGLIVLAAIAGTIGSFLVDKRTVVSEEGTNPVPRVPDE